VAYIFEVFFIKDYKKDEDIEHCGSPIETRIGRMGLFEFF